MLPCIYCNARAGLTDEHVFPAAIGGRAVVRNAVCSAHNNTFSRSFEQEVARQLVELRNLLDIPNRRGEVPPAPARYDIDGFEAPGRRHADGRPEVHYVPPIPLDDEGRLLRYHTFTPEAAARLQAEVALAGDVLEAGTTVEREIQGTMRTNFAFVASEGAKRNVAKIALNALALSDRLDVAASDRFAPLRNYILEGDRCRPVRLFLNQDLLNRWPFTARHHVVLLAADSERTAVNAIIVLFGALFYFVTLGQDYHGVDRRFIYGFDSADGNESHSFAQEDSIAIIRDVLSGPTVWDNVPESVRWLIHYVQQARPDIRIERDV